MVAPRDPWVGVPIHRLKWQSGFVKTWQGVSSTAIQQWLRMSYGMQEFGKHTTAMRRLLRSMRFMGTAYWRACAIYFFGFGDAE